MSDLAYQFDRPLQAQKSIAAKAAKAIKTVGQKFGQNIFEMKGLKSLSSQQTRGLPARPVKKNPFQKAGGKAKGSRDLYKKRQSGSVKSGLNFPVGRILTKLRKSRISDRVSKLAGVYMTSVMEYMISEIVEQAGNVVRESKKRFIFPRHIYLSIENDDEMKKYLGNNVIMPTVGRKVYTHPYLTTTEKIPSKNFQVVTKDLKNIKSYNTTTQKGDEAANSSTDEDKD